MPTGNQTERAGSAVTAGFNRPRSEDGGASTMQVSDMVTWGEPAKKAHAAAAVCRSMLASLCDRVSYGRAGHSTVLYSSLLLNDALAFLSRLQIGSLNKQPVTDREAVWCFSSLQDQSTTLVTRPSSTDQPKLTRLFNCLGTVRSTSVALVRGASAFSSARAQRQRGLNCSKFAHEISLTKAPSPSCSCFFIGTEHFRISYR